MTSGDSSFRKNDTIWKSDFSNFLLSWKYWTVRSVYQSYPGNSGSYDPYISPMLMSRGGRGGSPGAAEPSGGPGGGSGGGAPRRACGQAAATSQQLSHLARALDHHAQGPNIPFGNPSLRRIPRPRAIDVRDLMQKPII